MLNKSKTKKKRFSSRAGVGANIRITDKNGNTIDHDPSEWARMSRRERDTITKHVFGVM